LIVVWATDRSLGHHFSEVSKAELVTQVPTHTKDNNFAIKVAPVEQSVDVFQLTHPLALVKNSSVTDQRIRFAPQPLERCRVLDPKPDLGFVKTALENLKRAIPEFADVRIVHA